MPWTYDQRIEKATQLLVDKDLILEDQIETLTRPLYHGTYKFSIGIAATPESWYRYEELQQLVEDGLADFDCEVQCNPSLYDFYIYGNDPSVIRWVAKHHEPFFVTFVRHIHPDYWGKPPVKTQTRSSFYGQFKWRVRMKDAMWGRKPEHLERLNGLSGAYKAVNKMKTHASKSDLPHIKNMFANGNYRIYQSSFVYLEKLSDVLMFKLMVAEDIADIEERK